MTRPRRIFIADDHGIVRHGLAALVSDSDDLIVAGLAADGRAVLDALDTADWDLLVLDLNMPKVAGSEVFAEVRRRRPALPVLIFSVHAHDALARDFLANGAAGYLSKDLPPDELLAAIRLAAHGAPVPRAPADPPADRPRAPHETLSPREYQVFALVLAHLSPGEIAARLDLGPSTVSTHLARIRQKLGARNVADIVDYAHRAGLA